MRYPNRRPLLISAILVALTAIPSAIVVLAGSASLDGAPRSPQPPALSRPQAPPPVTGPTAGLGARDTAQARASRKISSGTGERHVDEGLAAGSAPSPRGVFSNPGAGVERSPGTTTRTSPPSTQPNPAQPAGQPPGQPGQPSQPGGQLPGQPGGQLPGQAGGQGGGGPVPGEPGGQPDPGGTPAEADCPPGRTDDQAWPGWDTHLKARPESLRARPRRDSGSHRRRHRPSPDRPTT